jgi:hypothetical protein
MVISDGFEHFKMLIAFNFKDLKVKKPETGSYPVPHLTVSGSKPTSSEKIQYLTVLRLRIRELFVLKTVWRIRDVYPGSRILIFTHPGSRIPNPKTATKERGEKKLLSYLFCS